MLTPRHLRNRLERFIRGALHTWYDPGYRPPLTSLETRLGVEPRRADYVAWYLLEEEAMEPGDLRRPYRAEWRDLARVHTLRHLESLSDGDKLAELFGVEVWDIPTEELLHTVRLACGGTIEAARAALRERDHTLNLLGGFQHATPDAAAGLSLLNDVAVAIEVLRSEGLRGDIVVLGLGARWPSGIAECLADDPDVHVFGLHTPELPAGCGDEDYLEALDGLLERVPRAALSFVIAGGDVLEADRFGDLGLSLAGARQRDLAVARALRHRAAVWLPGGGFHDDAWRVLAGTALAVGLASDRPIDPDFDPLRAWFSRVSREIGDEQLGGDTEVRETEALERQLGWEGPDGRLLNFYTPQGVEYALFQYGLLDHLKRLGYREIEVRVDRTVTGDRLQVTGASGEDRLLLVEAVLAVEHLDTGRDDPEPVLFVHWLTLRHPRGQFSPRRPKLPGQETPGLGWAPEAAELLGRVARRLGLGAVVFRPAWYHVAYATRASLRFIGARDQGVFEALIRDLADVPLLEATKAVAEKRVLLDGEPFTWPAVPMIGRPPPSPDWEAERDRVRASTHFELS